jgi:Leucine-rich repeat (LRR) protein
MLTKYRMGDAILSLENQNLSDFPLLSDLKTHAAVAGRIKRLVLNGNQLSSLDWLHVLPNLTSLEANKNKLCSLPDTE